jgi:hypothetical protein
MGSDQTGTLVNRATGSGKPVCFLDEYEAMVARETPAN